MRFDKPLARQLVGIIVCTGCLLVARTGSVVGGHPPVLDVAPAFDGRTSFDGVRLLAVGSDGVPAMWNVLSGSELARFRGHTERASAVALSPDGSYVLTGSGRGGDLGFASTDSSVRLWDAVSAREVRRYTGHTGFITGVAFSTDGSRILTQGHHAARVWDVGTGRLLAAFPEVGSASLSGDNRKILGLHAYGGWVKIWDVDTGGELHVIKGDTGRIWGAEFSSNARLLVVAAGNTAQIWDAETGRQLRLLNHKSYVVRASFSADGQMVLTASHDQTARLWDASTAREVKRFEHPGKVNQVLLSRDGSRLLTKWASPPRGEVSDRVSLWAIPTGTELTRFTDDVAGTVVGFSPDGSTFPIFNALSKTVRLCYSLTGECR